MLLLSLQGTGGRPPGAHLQAFPRGVHRWGGGVPGVPQERLPTPRGARGGTARSHTGCQASRHLLETAGAFPFSTPEGGALRPLLNLGFNLPGASLRAYLWDSGRSQPRMAPKPGPVMTFSDLHTGKQATGSRWQGQGRVQPAHRTRYTGKAGRGHGPPDKVPEQQEQLQKCFLGPAWRPGCPASQKGEPSLPRGKGMERGHGARTREFQSWSATVVSKSGSQQGR